MAVASRAGRGELARQWNEREGSPERTRVWTEPKPRGSGERRVPVVYYLSRNGQLEHPHFMEVPIPSADGLYLRDVINRLNFLRGKGIASMYSWSSKRGYKNGFVWHDLSEDDFIYPAHGHEYVLKGSELLHRGPSPRSQETTPSSSSSEKPLEISRSFADDAESPLLRRKKKSWSSLDLSEYKVYKTELSSDAATKAADASTQTDDKRHRRRELARDDDRGAFPSAEDNPSTELGRDEISPPPSSSSPETLESLIKADGRLIPIVPEDTRDRTSGIGSSGRLKASAVLMHLISCGSISVKDTGLSMASQYKARLPRRGGGVHHHAAKEMDGLIDNPSFPSVGLEDKAYFSGSLIETKKKASDGVSAEFSSLKRSSSYNADRSLKEDLGEKEMDGVRAKCIPRKSRGMARKEMDNTLTSRSVHGSKRLNEEPSPIISRSEIPQ